MGGRRVRLLLLGGAVLATTVLVAAVTVGPLATVAGGSQELSIAAAADLKFAMDELVGVYQQDHPNTEITVTYGSSGTFFAQLGQGAPFDLFFSADESYPMRLEDQGIAVKGSTFPYAIGRIVVWVPNGSALDVKVNGLEVLLDPAARHIAIANPEHAPYGKAAVAALEYAGLYEQVKDRLVLGENVAQAAQYAESGSADVGIIALSLALAPTLADQGTYWEIPADYHPEIDQGAAIISASKAQAAAKDFASFMQSPAARAVMQRYGFVLPGEG